MKVHELLAKKKVCEEFEDEGMRMVGEEEGMRIVGEKDCM